MWHWCIYHWDVTKHTIFVFKNINYQSIPLRMFLGKRRKRSFIHALLYIWCTLLLYVWSKKWGQLHSPINSPPQTLSKWIGHSLHLRKTNTDFHVTKDLNNLSYTNLTMITEIQPSLASYAHAPQAFSLLLQSIKLLCTTDNFHMNISYIY